MFWTAVETVVKDLANGYAAPRKFLANRSLLGSAGGSAGPGGNEGLLKDAPVC